MNNSYLSVVSVREVEVADDPNPSSLRTYRPRRNIDPNCKIWEAIVATLAEPELFPPIPINSGNSQESVLVSVPKAGGTNPWSVAAPPVCFYFSAIYIIGSF